jgi:hypothetical protein
MSDIHDRMTLRGYDNLTSTVEKRIWARHISSLPDRKFEATGDENVFASSTLFCLFVLYLFVLLPQLISSYFLIFHTVINLWNWEGLNSLSLIFPSPQTGYSLPSQRHKVFLYLNMYLSFDKRNSQIYRFNSFHFVYIILFLFHVFEYVFTLFFLFFFFFLLRLDLRALCVLGKHSTTWVMLLALTH